MSKSSALLVLIMAIICGLFASVTVMKYVRQQQENSQAAVKKTVQVVVAKDQIPAGTALLPEQIILAERQQDSVPQGSFDTLEKLKGRVSRTTIYPGEVVLDERLIVPGTPGGLPALIPDGYRAVTVKVDDTKSVAGFVRPGHHVDILVTIDVNENINRDTVCKVILQNVKIIATGQEIEMNEGDEGKKNDKQAKIVPTVTVLVTLEQAERITLASNAGTIRLVLRSHTDQIEETTEGANLSNLITHRSRKLEAPVEMMYSPAAATPVEKKPAKVVDVFRGAEKISMTFE
jgi:pilus assembly protein CpaB